MKILLINDYGTATGGAELQMLSLRQGLQERGHEVRLFSSSALLVSNYPLHSDYQCFGTTNRLQVLSQTLNLSAYWSLRRVLKEFQPDVVHVRMFMWQLSPLILPLLTKIPCLYQTAVYKAICPLGTKLLPDGSPCRETAGRACLNNQCLTFQSWAALMLQRQLWQRWRNAFDVVVALSYKMKANLEAEGISPVQVVHNGVAFRPPRPPLSYPPTVAFAGRLTLEKGVQILLKAFAHLQAIIPESRLMIAGEGSEANNLQALAVTLGIQDQIIWLGHISRAELEEQFDTAWVQVVPSLWDEPFGNVTTEAMMRGTAVIASRVGAQPEIINDGETGLLIPPNDVEALTSALKSLLTNLNWSEEIGHRSRQEVLNNFTEDKRTEKFLDIYQQIYLKYQNQKCA